MTSENLQHVVAVIGAGPAGLYAAKRLAENGVRVVIFNRDIKPGGLAEYGIYYNKYKMKQGLRRQFQKILDLEQISYYGNVSVGMRGDFTLDDLQRMGFQAIVAAVGAQGTKWLGLPGEDLKGVYHAKELVYHYNKLPPYSERNYAIGRRVALIGVGNVMVDIAHWLIRDLKVDQVTAVARRGPAEVKFTKKELENVARNLDVKALDEEIERVTPQMQAVDQDPEAAKEFILSALPKALEPVSDSRFTFEFLASPKRILGDENGYVSGLLVEDTELVLRNGSTKTKNTGTTRVLDVDSVIFCIGDKVDENFGLPVEWNAFVKNPDPNYPVDGISYEVFDPTENRPIEGIFVTGWSREASSGLVGLARKDGESGALAVLGYLDDHTQPLEPALVLSLVDQSINNLNHPVVDKEAVWAIEAVERSEAQARGEEDFKFESNSEMLKILTAGEMR